MKRLFPWLKSGLVKSSSLDYDFEPANLSPMEMSNFFLNVVTQALSVLKIVMLKIKFHILFLQKKRVFYLSKFEFDVNVYFLKKKSLTC